MPTATISCLLPSAEYLRLCFAYAPETGELTWMPRPREHFKTAHGHQVFLSRYAGKPSGSVSLGGYVVVGLDGRVYRAHRVIWAIVTGRWPSKDIDHVNLDRRDNRWENLRDVEYLDNSHRQSRRTDNKSSVTGVHYHSGKGKWCAQIGGGKLRVSLGTFDSFEEAVAARQAANIKYGYAYNHGGDKNHVQPVVLPGRVSYRNSSRVTGCYWHAHNKRWVASIRVDNVKMYLGSFGTLEEAAIARHAAEDKYRAPLRNGQGPAPLF